MDEVPRRTFCALAAASSGALAGCSFASDVAFRDGDGSGSDVLVETRTELEAAFENLSQGDTVYVSAENAPYRTTQWLDVDVDGVTVIGSGVETLIQPADGANVGGIRIGNERHCREIDVRGVSYDGNPSGQRDGAARCHGIVVRNASNVTIARNQIRRTHPRRHGDGGSGISVAKPCSGVRVFDNRVHEFGDRGIQVAGSQLQVFGNVVTNGLDRPIACDLWYPDGTNRTAQSVSIFGNLVGNSLEGSLVGVARNGGSTSNRGFVSIFGNVGFGSHKSFCHVRGPGTIRNVNVQNNVSIQDTSGLQTEETKQYSGIAVDVDAGRNVAVKNNELYDYSGHGIRVKSAVTGLSVQHNDVFDPALDGVRLGGRIDGMVDGNLVARSGEAGIRLGGTGDVVVSGNYVREASTSGVVANESASGTGTEVVGNVVSANARGTPSSHPGILVRDSGVGVHGNVVRKHAGTAIAERQGAGANRYTANRADGDRPWRIRNPSSVVRNHVPAVGVHRGVKTGPRSRTVRIEFERPYAAPPRLSFGRTGGGVVERTFETDDAGNYVGVTLVVRNEASTVDIFVDDVA